MLLFRSEEHVAQWCAERTLPRGALLTVAQGLRLVFVLEERLVGPNNLGVLPQPRTHAGTQPNDALDALGRQERVTQDDFGLLADAVDPTRALDQPNDRPREVKVDDHGAVLQVLPFRQHVGRDQDAQFISRHLFRLAV